MDWRRKIEKAGREDGWTTCFDIDGVILERKAPSWTIFTVNLNADSLTGMIQELDLFVQDFDVSEATYQALDETGHGKDGAPYELIDVWTDIFDCRQKSCKLLGRLIDLQIGLQ